MNIAGSGSEFGSQSISQKHGSADPDPHQNVMDPRHWFFRIRQQFLALGKTNFIPHTVYIRLETFLLCSKKHRNATVTEPETSNKWLKIAYRFFLNTWLI
jgi:hypothetical protein